MTSRARRPRPAHFCCLAQAGGYNESMRFLPRAAGATRAVLDVGSRSIKLLVFKAASGASGQETPRILHKRVVSLPPATAPLSLVSALEEVIVGAVKELGRMPDSMLAGLDVNFGNPSLVSWTIAPPTPRRVPDRSDLRAAFEEFVRAEREKTSVALAAYPFQVLVNGYPGVLERLRRGDHVLVREITFRALVLVLSEKVSRSLERMRQILGGIAIEFVPLVAAFAEAAAASRPERDALIIDVGAAHTTLITVRRGELDHVSFAPIGADRFAEALGAAGVPRTEAEDALRRPSRGLNPEHRDAAAAQVAAGVLEDWSQGFTAALDGFYDRGPLPADVLLTGRGALIPEVAGLVRLGGWIQTYSWVTKPRVAIWEGRSVFGGDSLGGAVGDASESGIASLAFWALRHKPVF